jgi:hypothetical protein
MKYKVKNMETGITEEWSVSRVLEEINRDRSPEWTPYDETDDLVSAWHHWVEPEEVYSIVK